MKIALRVNDHSYSVEVAPRRLLLDCLRDDLGLTGTKEGCGIGVCGACTVLVDGRLTSSCLELAIRCQDAEIVTIEGIVVLDKDFGSGYFYEIMLEEGKVLK